MTNPVHISGSDVDVSLGTLLIHFEDFSLTIEDGRKAVKTRGVPNGHVNGMVGASGSIALDTQNLNLMIASAKNAGSFQDLEPFDITSLGKTVNQELKIQAFGCLVKLSDLLSANQEGGEKLKHTVPYEVTDRRFVYINDVPYLSPSRTEALQ